MFSRSQDKWECDLNLTCPPFKLNGFRTTGPRKIRFAIPDIFTYQDQCVLIDSKRHFISHLLHYKSLIFAVVIKLRLEPINTYYFNTITLKLFFLHGKTCGHRK